jgi:germination protein YpeB
MKKRYFAIPVLIGFLAILGLGYWGFKEQQTRKMAEAYVNNNYQRSFYNLADHVQNMEVLLSKSLLVSEKKYDGKVYSDIWQHASAAQENLTQLPVNQSIVGRTSKFLTQVGDYSRMMAAGAGSDTEISSDKWKTLNKLYLQSQELNKDLQTAQSNLMNGHVSIQELAGESGSKMQGQAKKLASSNFQQINQKVQDYPALIYDGPFSDHLEKTKPRGVTGASIGVSEARSKALGYIEQSQKTNLVAQVTDKTKGKIPSYRTEIYPQKDNKNKTVVEVTQQGGHLIWLINTRSVGKSTVSIDAAIKKAQQYLAKHGYKNMMDTYYVREDGSVTINFAYVDKNDIIYYDDLIKVTVALDNGDIVAVDASGYLMSHYDRKLAPPKVTMAEAKKAVNKNVNIKGGRLAVIPTDSGGEKLTYEFSGVLNKEIYLIYIDSQTGKQEKILKVIGTNNGTLTM